MAGYLSGRRVFICHDTTAPAGGGQARKWGWVLDWLGWFASNHRLPELPELDQNDPGRDDVHKPPGVSVQSDFYEGVIKQSQEPECPCPWYPLLTVRYDSDPRCVSGHSEAQDLVVAVWKIADGSNARSSKREADPRWRAITSICVGHFSFQPIRRKAATPSQYLKQVQTSKSG